MKKQLILTGALLATVSALQAQTVIGNFEAGSFDGWAPQGTATFASDALGATLGTSSLKIVAPAGWGTVAKLDLIGMGLVPALSQAGTSISLDLTLRADDGSIPGWWEQSILILNSDSTGWTDLGTKSLSVSWGPSTTHLTWTIPDAKSALLPSATSYAELFLANNSGGATIYVDNIVVATVPEPATTALVGLGLAGMLILRRRA